MKCVLSLVLLLTVLTGSAQNKKAAFASAPLGRSSVGKQFDRAQVGEKLPGINLEGKYILIDVFFQACGPCRASIPYLNDLADTTKYPQLQVVSVDPFKEDSATMPGFIQHFKIQYPVITGQQGLDIWKMIRNEGYPFLLLVDPKGKIVSIKRGFSKEGFKDLTLKIR